MRITREWAMPSSKTFSIKPIKELIYRHINENMMVVDPFSNNCRIATVTNDLNPECDADHHMDALDFLRMFPDEGVDCVLYDPPYSPRQVAECYKQFGKTVNMQTTQSTYWSKQKTEIARIVKPGGLVITCGWNSGGIGKNKGFEILEILLVPHGGRHNDTIVTVERKIDHENTGGTERSQQPDDPR